MQTATLFEEEWREATHIEIDTVLLYRDIGMDDFELGLVLAVSHDKLEVLCEKPVPMNTAVTLAVKAQGATPRFFRIVTIVRDRKQHKAGWAHILTGLPERPWSPMVLHDVMCLTLDSAPTPLDAYEDACRKRHLARSPVERTELNAWELSILSGRTIGLDHAGIQASVA